ncbi:MAG: type II secretion system GspH family protein, partial [Proteobacteria bacterium]|nr:type II secretion system GspH family protein [Pseudomonadota bacterium]
MTKENIMQKSGGFTLLEVLVALAITGIAVTYIIQLFSVNLQSISSSGNHVNATLQAEARMRQILDDDMLEKQSFTEITDDGYRMDIAVSEVMPERTENL